LGYIQEIRQLIGRRPFILVGAGVLICDQNNRVMLLQRSDYGCWGIPGGAMEPGESLEETARRETLEETGLSLGELKLWNVFSGMEQYYQYPNGDEVYNVSAVFLAREYSGQMQFCDGEHRQARFFEIDALPDGISPPVKPILIRYAQEFAI
jgi:ADP-ribose pyrophosphatase YjhB (NUDIX family)